MMPSWNQLDGIQRSARSSRLSGPPEDALRRLFGLTPAEARLALLVGQGKVPKEAATQLGISWNTARCQLRQVFAKTGTDRQAAVVRLLASLGVIIQLDDTAATPRSVG